MTNSAEITRDQIRRLRTKSASIGDIEQVELCDVALTCFGSDPDSTAGDEYADHPAVIACASIIAYAESR